MDPAHPYVHRDLGCPCPALASLINHSYLTPEDETQEFPAYKLVFALRRAFNLSWPLCIYLVLDTLRRARKLWYLSIYELSAHGVIEHNGSITRLDIGDGRDPLRPNEARIQNFLDSSKSSDVVTLQDYAIRRSALDAGLHGAAAKRPKHIPFLARGETSLIMMVFGVPPKGKGGEGEGPWIPKPWLDQLYKREQLPQDWRKPTKPVGFIIGLRYYFDMKRRMEQLRR